MLVKSKIKYIQSLGEKKFREDDGVFIAEGPKIINELLSSGHVTLISLFALPEWIESSYSSLKMIESRQVESIDQRDLKRISFLSTPNQVLGLFHKPVFPEFESKGRITLLLDNIQDPGNLGTMIRIADWFDIKNIVCSETTTDVFNPKSVQSTMGSISRVQVLYKDLSGFIKENNGLPLYGAILDGTPIVEYGRIGEGLILIGNESKGINKLLLEYIQHKVSIPRKGRAESLNVAVATGIILSYLAGY